MAGIILSGPDVAQVFGPAPAPIVPVRLLVKAGKGVALQGAISRWIAPLKLKGELRLAVDIDPQSFL